MNSNLIVNSTLSLFRYPGFQHRLVGVILLIGFSSWFYSFYYIIYYDFLCLWSGQHCCRYSIVIYCVFVVVINVTLYLIVGIWHLNISFLLSGTLTARKLPPSLWPLLVNNQLTLDFASGSTSRRIFYSSSKICFSRLAKVPSRPSPTPSWTCHPLYSG